MSLQTSPRRPNNYGDQCYDTQTMHEIIVRYIQWEPFSITIILDAVNTKTYVYYQVLSPRFSQTLLDPIVVSKVAYNCLLILSGDGNAPCFHALCSQYVAAH